MKTEKLFILGNNLIQAKKRYYRAEFALESALSDFGIIYRREMKTAEGRTTEGAINNKVMEAARVERNEIKLAKINLSEAEILYDMEKLRLQYEGENNDN